MIARLAAAALTFASLAAAPVHADDLAAAKGHFRRGVELYRQKRWGEAMAEFETAYRLKPHGAIHFNVAQCRERLEDWPGALRSYQDYLREVPGAADRAVVRASMARIEARLAASGVQLLIVYSDPPGARVAVDGEDLGATPLHAVLTPGAHAVALALDGYEPVKEQVEISAVASRVVDVVLTPSAQRTAGAAPDLAPRPSRIGAATSLVTAPAEPKAPRARRHIAAWIAAGTAVAAAGAGVWLGWSARQDARAIDAMSTPDPTTASALAHSAQTKARAANVLYGIAGGAAAVGGTLFVFETRF